MERSDDRSRSASPAGETPESIREQVAQAVSLVRALVPERRLGVQALPDRPQIVSILGARGTGKSTVLHHVARSLDAIDGYFVLPVIDPEAFALGDSMLGWVLAFIDDRLTRDERAYVLEDDADRRSLGQLLEELRRAQAIRAAGYLPGLATRGLALDDFARDAIRVPAQSTRFGARVGRLFEALALARGESSLQVIVPVDDADLFPELLPSIVTDMRMLATSLRVITIFAADRATLARSLQIASLSTEGGGTAAALSSGLMTAAELRESVARSLVKHFPRSLRLTLATIEPDQRVQFAPLANGGSPSLITVLDRFRLPDNSGRTLADFFRIRSTSGEPIAVSPYARVLSDNARDLRQLYEALDVIDPERGTAAADAVQVLLAHGLDGLEWDLPERARSVLTLRRADDGTHARFDLDDLDFAIGAFSGPAAFRRPPSLSTAAAPSTGQEANATADEAPLASYVRLRTLSRIEAVLVDRATEGAEGSVETREELPERFAYLLCFAWEAVYTSEADESATQLLKSDGHSGVFPKQGLSAWAGYICGTDGEPGSWAYWTVPEWDNYLNYFMVHEGWKRLVDPIYGAYPTVPASPILLELLLVGYLDLVTTVQIERAVPAWIAELTSDGLLEMVSTWDAARPPRMERVADQLSKALEVERQSEFRQWVQGWLPLAATPLLTTHRMTDWLLELWQRVTPEESRSRAVEIIAALARQHVTEPMADGDIVLLRRVEATISAPSRAEILEKVVNEYREGRERGRLQVLATLRQANVDERVVAALERQGATQEVLFALVQANLRPNDVAAVAEAFPEVPVAGGADDIELSSELMRNLPLGDA